MLNIVICDDEPLFVNELTKLLERYAEETATEVRFSVFYDGQDLIDDYPIEAELIFLDIQMKKMNGLETAKEIRKINPQVGLIFLTSLVEHAIEGYNYNALNYLLKPINYLRLKTELDKWQTTWKNEKNDSIVVMNDEGQFKIALKELSHIETFNRKVMLHVGTDTILSYKRMKNFELELEMHPFVRCHASFIVNLNYIKRVEKLTIILTTGEEIPISQLKRKAVMKNLADHWGKWL